MSFFFFLALCEHWTINPNRCTPPQKKFSNFCFLFFLRSLKHKLIFSWTFLIHGIVFNFLYICLLCDTNFIRSFFSYNYWYWSFRVITRCPLPQPVSKLWLVRAAASRCNSSLCHLSTPLLLEEKKKHHCRTYLIRWCSSFLIDWITSKLLHQENLDLFSPCFQDCIFFVAYDRFALSVYLGSI